jgi:hypothetical protein
MSNDSNPDSQPAYGHPPTGNPYDTSVGFQPQPQHIQQPNGYQQPQPQPYTSQPQMSAKGLTGNRNPLNKPLDSTGKRDWSYDLFSCDDDYGLCEFLILLLIHFPSLLSLISALPLSPIFRYSHLIHARHSGCMAFFCPCSIYATNKSRLESLEVNGAPHPSGGQSNGPDCLVFGALHYLTTFSWILEVSRKFIPC